MKTQPLGPAVLIGFATACLAACQTPGTKTGDSEHFSSVDKRAENFSPLLSLIQVEGVLRRRDGSLFSCANRVAMLLPDDALGEKIMLHMSAIKRPITKADLSEDEANRVYFSQCDSDGNFEFRAPAGKWRIFTEVLILGNDEIGPRGIERRIETAAGNPVFLNFAKSDLDP